MARSRRLPWYWIEMRASSDATPVAAAYPLMFNILGFQAEMDRLFKELVPEGLDDLPPTSRAESRQTLVPRADIASHADGYSIAVELPGVDRQDITLEVRGNRLLIRAEKKNTLPGHHTCCVRERAFGTFSKEIRLPDHADPHSVKARLENGILCISLRKLPV